MQTTDRLEQIVLRLVERVEGRYYGKYRGTVSDNQDPDNLGRLRARVPRLLGDVETGWALPCAPYAGAKDQGLFMVPDQNAAVWIEFEGGDLAYPIWCGAWWGDDDVPDLATPDQKVLKTSSGHKIVFDDNAATVEVTDSNENKVTLDQNGITLEDANGNQVIMDSSGITLKGDTINVGDPATDNLVAFNALQTALTSFVTQLQSHTHATAVGPSGPPVPPPQLTLDPAKAKHQVEL